MGVPLDGRPAGHKIMGVPLDGPIPVTLVYSQVFANVVKQTPDIVNEIYDYRFFM